MDVPNMEYTLCSLRPGGFHLTSQPQPEKPTKAVCKRHQTTTVVLPAHEDKYETLSVEILIFHQA